MSSSKKILGWIERTAFNSILFGGMFLLTQLPALAAQNVTLAWNPSTDPAAVGYNLYYGGASGDYTNTISVGNATNVTVSALVEGTTYYFAATTYNSVGVESPFSNEVFYSVPTNAVTLNQPPTLNPINNLTINENAAQQTVNLYGITSGATNENQFLTVSATSSNPNLVPNPTVHYTSANTTGSLTFTPVLNANGSAIITVTVNDGGANNNIVTQTCTVTVNPVNQSPTLNTLNNLTINENAAQQTVNLSGITSGAANENQILTVSAVSSNPNLVPNPTVHYTSANTTGSLTFTPGLNANGSAIVTVTVNDGGDSNNIVTQTFTVTVNPVNQPPTLNAINNLTISENAAQQTVNLSGITSGATNENQTLTVNATSSNPNLIPNPTVNYSSANTTGSLTFTPALDANGSAIITVTVNDGGTSNNTFTRTFTVTVSPVNQPPTLNSIADLRINENSGQQTVNLAGITSGAANENQVLTVSAVSSNPNLVPNPTAHYTSANTTGTLTFTPGLNANGSAIITVTVNDGGANNNIVTQTFTVTVNPVNQPPTLNPINNLTINENAGQQTVNLSGISSGAANENQFLTVSATSSNPGLVPNPTVNYSSANTSGSLTFTPVSNTNGTAIITVTINDGGTSNNIVVQTFTVNVLFSNDHTPPAVQITTPTLYQQWTNGTFTATGKASDNVAVGTVYYSLNGSDWTAATTANNWTNWTANLTLTAGTNTVQAYAADISGNNSPTNTVTFEYVVLKPLTMSIKGQGSVYPNRNGTMLAVNENYTMTAYASTYGFGFTNWTGSMTTNSATLVFRMKTNLTITANFQDVLKPGATIVTPTLNQQWTNGTFTVTGKTSDNLAVGTVYYSLNGSSWAAATTGNNWTNWTANLTLTPGTNILQAYAVDTTGNISPTNTVRFQYVVLKPLTVSINGKGMLYPNYNGALLAINENYTMTAMASTYGFGFTNWTGSMTTNSTVLRFTMQANLTFTANFVDVLKPTVTIVTPTLNQQWTNVAFTMSGKAGDNVAVAAVYYSLNGSSWATATTGNNWTNWTANLSLAPGNNIVRSYAVDTTGNISLTNSVSLTYATAPTSLSGLMGAVNEDNGGTFNLCFGTGTFSQNSSDTNYENGVGNYTYTQLNPATAQLSLTYTALPNLSGTRMVVTLTFITNNECIFNNQSNVMNTGTIHFQSASNWAPASVYGKTSALIADGQMTTAAFGAATLTITNSAGQVTNGNYTFKQYSPLGALLTITQPNKTNFMQLTFGATNYGAYYATVYDRSNSVPTTGTGAFAMLSESPGGNAPASLAGTAALVTQPDGSFEMNFGTATFSQNSFTTNYANGVGAYTYTKSGADSAELSYTYTAPPTVANAVAPVTLTFIAPNFCVLNNQDNSGSNIIVAISFRTPPTNWVPASLTGQSLHSTNADGVGDVMTFNGGGTFSQNETGSSNPGVSSGTYTFTPYGPLGGMLVLTYNSGVLAGSVSYVQTTFTAQGMGNSFVTFYDASADPPVTSSGSFAVQ